MRHKARRSAGALVAIGLLPATVAVAAEGPALPDPLTLEHSLALVDTPHPDLDSAQARLDAARAGLTQAESNRGLRAHIDVTPQLSLPSQRGEDDYVNDSRARFFVSKRLYDFGRSSALADSAQAEIEARAQRLVETRQARRLEIMARFLDTVLADLRYAVDNEAMAQSYVTFDRQRERHKFGQVSDVDLLEFEARYQENLIARTRSQKRQTQTRQQLALALNRPDELPANLSLPVFPGNDREPPDFKKAFEQAMDRSPASLALRKEVEAARTLVAAERARRYPVLSADGELAYYERKIGSRDDARATLNLRVPLWQGGEDRAAIELALARQHEAEARLRRAAHDLRQTVLDLTQEIESLRIERNAAKVRSAWRGLTLDRSRALYEMEVRADLGDAMTRITEAQWLAAQVEFRLALAWARLEALAGPLDELSVPESAK